MSLCVHAGAAAQTYPFSNMCMHDLCMYAIRNVYVIYVHPIVYMRACIYAMHAWLCVHAGAAAQAYPFSPRTPKKVIYKTRALAQISCSGI
jgi:hypothetical protein